MPIPPADVEILGDEIEDEHEEEVEENPQEPLPTPSWFQAAEVKPDNPPKPPVIQKHCPAPHFGLKKHKSKQISPLSLVKYAGILEGERQQRRLGVQ